MGNALRNFQTFHSTRARRGSAVACITITKSGVIGLNTPAYEALGRPQRIVYGFEHETGRAGIHAASDDDKAAYRVRSNGTAGSSWQVSAHAFLVTYDISHVASHVYRAEMAGDWLAFTPERAISAR